MWVYQKMIFLLKVGVFCFGKKTDAKTLRLHHQGFCNVDRFFYCQHINAFYSLISNIFLHHLFVHYLTKNLYEGIFLQDNKPFFFIKISELSVLFPM